MLKTQLQLIEENSHKNNVTFKNNKEISIHKWYPYVEGFSEDFVLNILNVEKENKADLIVYDPFNGSGTTALVCSHNFIKSLASEVNPLMRFIADTKINIVKKIISEKKINYLKELLDMFDKFNDDNYDSTLLKSDYISDLYLDKDFFDENTLKKITFIKYFISKKILDFDMQNIFRVALAGITVKISNMIRAADLRKRKPNELLRKESEVIGAFKKNLHEIYLDILSLENKKLENLIFISNNSKVLNQDYENTVDLVITSPPYVNGTNYFRNTKLELWILDLVSSEKELKELRTQAIIAGINNVSSSNKITTTFDFVEEYALKLDEVIKLDPKKDSRISKMVRGYFSDIHLTLLNLYKLLKVDGKVYWDIGDSEYYGINIPVDEITIKIAEMIGFEIISNITTRSRNSRNGNLLKQSLVILKKKKKMKF